MMQKQLMGFFGLKLLLLVKDDPAAGEKGKANESSSASSVGIELGDLCIKNKLHDDDGVDKDEEEDVGRDRTESESESEREEVNRLYAMDENELAAEIGRRYAAAVTLRESMGLAVSGPNFRDSFVGNL